MRLRPFLALACAAPLAACISFGPKTPNTLMSLSADAKVAAGPARAAGDASTVGVAFPIVPQSLASLRVPVQASPTSVAFLKDAQWVEPPSRLFRALLAETIEAKTGRVVPDTRIDVVAPDLRLQGRLEAFGLDAARSEAVVTYDAVLVRKGQDKVQTRRFEARVPVAAITAEAAPAAINRAANQVAGEVADWVGG